MRKSPCNSGVFYLRGCFALTLFTAALLLIVVGFSQTASAGKGSKKIRKSAQSVSQVAPPSGNTGPGWSIVNSPNTTEQQLVSTTCLSATDCWAVGYYVDKSGDKHTLTEHWDGGSWKIVSAPNGVDGFYGTEAPSQLESVACTSSSDCWAVGTVSNSQYTVIEHWNGASWSVVSSPNPSSPTTGTPSNQLHGVTCASSNDCWAVGTYRTGTQNRFTQTLIEHWNGSSWSVVTSPNTGPTLLNRLNAVTCTSSSSCWAVGDALPSSSNQSVQTLVQHWDGSTWSIVTSPNLNAATDNVLKSVTCNGANDCLTVGYYAGGTIDANGNAIYQTLTQRWTGAAWIIVSSSNTSALDTNLLLGVACSSSSQCWAVGYASGPTSEQALIEQWNGTSWSIVPPPVNNQAQYTSLFAIACTSDPQCWAAGSADGAHTVTERWDGNTWSIVSSPDAVGGGSANYLGDVACNSSVDCWAVGSNFAGLPLIQHWNGDRWSLVFARENFGLFSALRGVTCTATNNCWAVGSQNDASSYYTLVEHWDGNTWTPVASPNHTGQDNFLLGVRCSSALDCWAVGYSHDWHTGADQTLIVHWDGNTWSIVASPNGPPAASPPQNQLNSVTCNLSSDCWAAGFSGDSSIGTSSVEQTLIEHWDGNSWSVVSSPNQNRNNYLNGITCTSSMDCWAVGSYDDGQNFGTLTEHWDGLVWMINTSGSGLSHNLNGVSCTSDSNCWAVGSGYGADLVAHWNGSSWSTVASPNSSLGVQDDLRRVTCLSSSVCWAVGSYQVQQSTQSVGQTLIKEYSPTLPALIGVRSRMTHGSAGTFDVDLPLIGKRGVECRSGGANGNYSIVFSFVNDVTNCGSAATAGETVVAGPNSNQCTENLTGVTNAQYVSVELDNVIDSQNNTGNVAVQMGVLIGDVNANGLVDGNDVSAVQSHTRQTVDNTNFRYDVNTNGVIDGNDVSMTQGQTRTSLPSSP